MNKSKAGQVKHYRNNPALKQYINTSEVFHNFLPKLEQNEKGYRKQSSKGYTFICYNKRDTRWVFNWCSLKNISLLWRL